MAGENPGNTDPIIAMYFQALEAMRPDSVYQYYDIVGVIGNKPVRPIITAPIYMTPFAETLTVLPTVEIFVNSRLAHPEDYEYYYRRIFNRMPGNVLKQQRQIWGINSAEPGYFEQEVNSMDDAAGTNSPIGVAFYGVEQNKIIKPENTLIGLYHLPTIRTKTVLDMMTFATNNRLAHVRGIEFH